jgi:hypothetical protein
MTTQHEEPNSEPRDRRWLLLYLVPLVVLVLLANSFVSNMGHSRQRLAGTNSVALQRPVIQISGGSLLCQSTLAPRDATSLQLFVVPTGPAGPPLEVSISRNERELARGQLAGGWVGGDVFVPISRIPESAADGTICIRNKGLKPLGFSGVTTEVLKALVDGRPQSAAITVLYFREGSESWWSLLPTIAHRAGVLKGALSGAWVFWLVVALVGAAGALGIATMVGGRRS